MVRSKPSLDDVYDLVQPEFCYVDQMLGRRDKRQMSIADIPQLERDLYLVFDLVAITCNAGMLTWVQYHHDEEGWIKLAQEAFIRINHKQVSDGLEECLLIYRQKQGSLTHNADDSQSRYIFDREGEIMMSLYFYLTSAGFSFPHFGK